MDAQELIAFLSEGQDAETAAAIAAVLNKDKVKTRTQALRQQRELDEIETKRQQLAAELDGEGPTKPGARAYRDWANKNGQRVKELSELEQKFLAKYGSIEAAMASVDGKPPADPAIPPPAAGMTEKQIKEMISAATDERIRDQYSGRWSGLLTGVGSIVQRHIFAGRKEPIDFKKVEELAGKYNGDLNLAYDEYDKPERDKEATVKTEAEINRRVQEEIQKRGAAQYFPSGADATPGALSAHRGTEKFDRAAMEADLLKTYQSGQYPGESKADGSRGSGFFGAN